MSTKPLLRTTGVSVAFGGLRALTNVDLTVNQGEVVGLIGPNGAGKTTLFNAICGIVKPDSGTFSFEERESWPSTDRLASIGISRTLQGVGLFPELTVLENVMIGANKFARTGLFSASFGANGRDEKELAIRAHIALERVYASPLANRRAGTLAYPDAKRVAIARALVSQPKLLLLDEPAGGLGAHDIEWLNRFIRELSGEMSVLIVEHHMDVVMSVCNRIYVLNFGEVISYGTPSYVRNDPAVISAYLGADAT
ncbi:MAG: ATP-binding cassette domain-containing protein [Actinobacteria bacterium]|nr:ATP-binding cassette domain-containing protein [Actinomycetota bacterium]